MRSLDSKCKKCRRAGEKLFLKGDRCFSPKCAIVRKSYPPGIHGKRRSRGLSEFGKQLAMKQKIKRIYGVAERQFRKHFDEVKNKKGIIGDLLLARLEMRLDSTIYSLALANSRAAARQMVTHGFFKLNGKKVNIPSMVVKVGDVITFNGSKAESENVKSQLQVLKNRKYSSAWLEFDFTKMEAKIKAAPKRDDIEGSVDPQMVVEYYSR